MRLAMLYRTSRSLKRSHLRRARTSAARQRTRAIANRRRARTVKRGALALILRHVRLGRARALQMGRGQGQARAGLRTDREVRMDIRGTRPTDITATANPLQG